MTSALSPTSFVSCDRNLSFNGLVFNSSSLVSNCVETIFLNLDFIRLFLQKECAPLAHCLFFPLFLQCIFLNSSTRTTTSTRFSRRKILSTRKPVSFWWEIRDTVVILVRGFAKMLWCQDKSRTR